MLAWVHQDNLSACSKFSCYHGCGCSDEAYSLDTGSSDIWVESADSELCRMPTQPCAATGTFSRDESSTYSRVSSDFDISYVDGEYARGDYGKDVFRFGDGTEVKDLQFGIGLESTSSEGIMGIGMAENEVQVQRLGKKPYKTLVELMVEQGIIKSKAYSLYLNDLGSYPLPFFYKMSEY